MTSQRGSKTIFPSIVFVGPPRTIISKGWGPLSFSHYYLNLVEQYYHREDQGDGVYLLLGP